MENKITIKRGNNKLMASWDDEGKLKNFWMIGQKARDLQPNVKVFNVRDYLMSKITWQDICEHELEIDYLGER